jgi:hypothetical protein
MTNNDKQGLGVECCEATLQRNLFSGDKAEASEGFRRLAKVPKSVIVGTTEKVKISENVGNLLVCLVGVRKLLGMLVT